MNEPTLNHIRETGTTAEEARRMAAYARAGIGNRLKPEVREANAEFWESIAQMCDDGTADWLD